MITEQLKNEYAYFMVQKMLQSLLEEGLITEEEFKKITEINQEKYNPKLREIMPILLDISV